MRAAFEQQKFIHFSRNDSVKPTGYHDPTGKDCIIAPVQGTQYYNRVGQEIQLTALHMQGQLTLAAGSNSANPPTPGYVRLGVLLDQTPSASITREAFNNIFTLSGSACPMIHSPVYDGRIEVIYDDIIELPSSRVTELSDDLFTWSERHIPFVIDLPDLSKLPRNGVCRFVTDLGTGADYIQNRLHFFAIGSAMSDWYCTYQGRVDFFG